MVTNQVEQEQQRKNELVAAAKSIQQAHKLVLSYHLRK